jgi:hypothetical protein
MSLLVCGMETFMVIKYWGSIIWSTIVYLNNHNKYVLIDI